VNLDGSGAPSSSGQTIVERPEFEDERLFLGGYALALWKPTDRWLIDAGLRLNHSQEEQEGEVETEHGEEQVTSERDETRLSGALGASFRLTGEENALWLFARYTDAFKPAALDFGPEAEGAILDPETAQTIEGGFKGSHLGGRLTWQASAYTMDFDNLVIAATVNGLPVLRNGGEQRFEGFELEAKLACEHGLSFQGSYASHSAKFRDFVQEFDGVPTQLAGKKLEMSPDELASLGVLWVPESGPFAHAEMNYTGDRFLNKRNTAPADPFTTYSAGFGYRFESFTIRIDGANLTDERDPVAESELGDAQYYLLPARSYRLGASFRFGG
jgi:iron complex outermembrane receptor protein